MDEKNVYSNREASNKLYDFPLDDVETPGETLITATLERQAKEA